MTRRKASKGNISVEDVFGKSDLIDATVPTKVKVKFKNQKQKEFATLIEQNEIIICSGVAGTGKSFISIGTALELIQSPNNAFKKIVIIKPVVESSDNGANLGFLKGSLREKLEPYAASSLEIVDKLIGGKARRKLEEDGIILIDTISFLRGKTFDNSILIMEESQNLTPNEMKTLLTRIGENSKFVISGDIDQSDRFKNVKDSGLYDAITRFKNLTEIKTFEFGLEDVVRNPIISKILKLYDNTSTSKPEIVGSKKQLLVEQDRKILTEPRGSVVPTSDKTKPSFIRRMVKYFKW